MVRKSTRPTHARKAMVVSCQEQHLYRTNHRFRHGRLPGGAIELKIKIDRRHCEYRPCHFTLYSILVAPRLRVPILRIRSEIQCLTHQLMLTRFRHIKRSRLLNANYCATTVPAPPHELPLFLLFRELIVFVPGHDGWVGVQHGLEAIFREGYVLVRL